MFIVSVVAFIVTVNSVSVNADCGVISKQQWDGLSPVHVEYLPRPVALVVIQHTATPLCTTDAACEAQLQAIQQNHMDQLHYWDIGPNFLVGGNGKVYEGSGWLHVGAHTYQYNRKSIGISFIGNFNTDVPADSAVEAAKALIQCGVDKGHLKPSYNLVAHRQLIAIESPGRKLYNLMRRWPNWLEDVSAIKN